MEANHGRILVQAVVRRFKWSFGAGSQDFVGPFTSVAVLIQLNESNKVTSRLEFIISHDLKSVKTNVVICTNADAVGLLKCGKRYVPTEPTGLWQV
jgi:hypothetical protein